MKQDRKKKENCGNISITPQKCSGSKEAGILFFLVVSHLWMRKFSGDSCLRMNMQNGPVPREVPYGKVIGSGITTQSHITFVKTYSTDVSKRTYFQAIFLWVFRLASRLNFMGMLENMMVYSYISLVCKYSANCNRCGLGSPYIFSSIDSFRTETEGMFAFFCFSCSLPNTCQFLNVLRSI